MSAPSVALIFANEQAPNIDSILRSIATQTIAERDISSNVIDPSNNNLAYSFTVGGFIT